MGNLVKLPGVKGGTIENVQFARTVSAAMNVLKTDRATTGAGDDGAWCVWRDDDGAFRCEFSRYCVAQSELTARTKAEVRAWLKEWMPKVQRSAA